MSQATALPTVLTAAQVDALDERAEALAETAWWAAADTAEVCVRAIAARVRLAHPTAARVHVAVCKCSEHVTVQSWATAKAPNLPRSVDPAIAETLSDRAARITEMFAETDKAIAWNEYQQAGWIDIDRALTSQGTDGPKGEVVATATGPDAQSAGGSMNTGIAPITADPEALNTRARAAARDARDAQTAAATLGVRAIAAHIHRAHPTAVVARVSADTHGRYVRVQGWQAAGSPDTLHLLSDDLTETLHEIYVPVTDVRAGAVQAVDWDDRTGCGDISIDQALRGPGASQQVTR